MDIRRRVLAVYCKEAPEFPTRAAYDDYLEEAESISKTLARGALRLCVS